MISVYNCIVCTNDLNLAGSIVYNLKKYKNFHVTKISDSLEEMEFELQSRQYDLLFLDNDVAEGNAPLFLSSIKLQIPAILVISGTNADFDAWEAGIIDHLEKPLDPVVFDNVIESVSIILSGLKYFLKKSENEHRLQNILVKEYNLSRTESSLCLSIAAGLNSEEILHVHSITRNTYKTHLRRIFSKTIEKGAESPLKSQGKLQRLTWFLMHLKDASW